MSETMLRKLSVLIGIVLLVGACGGGTHSTAPGATAQSAKWVRLPDDYPRVKFLAGMVGYQLDNGRILWVDEKTGAGNVIANPDEVNADQWSCDALLGPTAAFYDRYRGIPNFKGVVCRSYASVQPGFGT